MFRRRTAPATFENVVTSFIQTLILGLFIASIITMIIEVIFAPIIIPCRYPRQTFIVLLTVAFVGIGMRILFLL